MRCNKQRLWGLLFPTRDAITRLMDKLDQHIADKEAELSEIEARRAVLCAELEALRLAASLRPAATSGGPRRSKAASPSKGRTKGAISKEWRAVLAEVFKSNTYLSYEEIHDIAVHLGNDVALGSVRDRVRNMVKTGLLEGDPEVGFCVTDEAVERFEFTPENSGTAVPEEANTESASDTSGVLNLHARPPGQ